MDKKELFFKVSAVIKSVNYNNKTMLNEFSNNVVTKSNMLFPSFISFMMENFIVDILSWHRVAGWERTTFISWSKFFAHVICWQVLWEPINSATVEEFSHCRRIWNYRLFQRKRTHTARESTRMSANPRVRFRVSITIVRSISSDIQFKWKIMSTKRQTFELSPFKIKQNTSCSSKISTSWSLRTANKLIRWMLEVRSRVSSARYWRQLTTSWYSVIWSGGQNRIGNKKRHVGKISIWNRGIHLRVIGSHLKTIQCQLNLSRLRDS
jgi:hypothetical protein